MNDNSNRNCQQKCPSCNLPSPLPCPRNSILRIASSIAHEEDALACILEAECAKINKVLCEYSDYETLIAVNTSVQTTLERISELEGVLKAKLDSIIPFLNDCL